MRCYQWLPHPYGTTIQFPTRRTVWARRGAIECVRSAATTAAGEAANRVAGGEGRWARHRARGGIDIDIVACRHSTHVGGSTTPALVVRGTCRMGPTLCVSFVVRGGRLLLEPGGLSRSPHSSLFSCSLFPALRSASLSALPRSPLCCSLRSASVARFLFLFWHCASSRLRAPAMVGGIGSSWDFDFSHLLLDGVLLVGGLQH